MKSLVWWFIRFLNCLKLSKKFLYWVNLTLMYKKIFWKPEMMEEVAYESKLKNALSWSCKHFIDAGVLGKR